MFGSGLASLAAASFLIGDGCEMENHFECLWDLFLSITSLEVDDASVLDEFYWLNKENINSSKYRVIEKQGRDAYTKNKFTLTDKASEEMLRLFLTPEDKLEAKRIDDFFESNFWLYWCTMFSFERWHSALEMRRYIMRFIHHIGGLPDLSVMKFTKYNQYESLVAYLKEHQVDFQYDIVVNNILVDKVEDKKVARTIVIEQCGVSKNIELTENNLVFVTNSSITESTTYGDNNHPTPVTTELGGSWQL